MPSIRTPRLIHPDVLFNLKPSSISALLSPFAGYFAARGAPLECLNTANPVLNEIASVIASPVESTPPELVERLELLDFICNPQSGINFEDGYEALVERLRDDTDTEEDLAVKILIDSPDVAWREFDRLALKQKRMLSSCSHRTGLTFLKATPERIAQLERLLGPWFEKNARTGICRVHVREDAGGTSFVIRHGDLLKRLAVYEEDGSSASKILRPERVDVAYYRHFTGEWQISGRGRCLQEIYRRTLGTVFHGCPQALIPSNRFSLEPLRQGASILKCHPNSRIQYADVDSLEVRLPSGKHVLITRGNTLDVIEELSPTLLQCAILVEARLQLKIARKRRPVPVIINPVDYKLSGLHLDDAIEPWLAERGFFHQPDEVFFLESA